MIRTVLIFTLFISVSYAYWVGCRTRDDCPDHAHCNANLSVCFCDNNFIYVRVKDQLHCLPVGAGVGANCQNDIQCQAGLGKLASCRQGSCVCTKESHYLSGICYPSVLMGDKCNVTNECIVRRHGLLAYCDIHNTGTCICPPGFHPSPDRTDCIPDTALGDPCTNDSDCSSIFAECRRVCVCKSDYSRSLNKTTCLPVAKKLGEKCLENPQCTARIPNSRCHSGNLTCVCQDNARRMNNTCSISVPLGGYCQIPEDCQIRSQNASRVQCREGICGCHPDFHHWRDDCVQHSGAFLMQEKSNTFVVTACYILSLLVAHSFKR